MNENEMDGKDENVNGETAAEIVRIENERITRRKALRKFGFTAGMAIFSVLSVDDLARVASKKLQDTEATKGIGDMLAKEFRSAGVAMANPYGGGGSGGGGTNPYNPYNPPLNCVEQANATARECYDYVNAHHDYGSPIHDYFMEGCNAEWRDRIAHCNGGGSGGGGNPYAGTCADAQDCTTCCNDAHTAANQQCDANAVWCTENGWPAGNPICIPHSSCIINAALAHDQCEYTCDQV